ncbi:CZB domain-containing protein [Oscillospiraceae bacterium PP1C4]
MKTLKNCFVNGEEFSLPTNPHDCAFGKWYDNYKPINHTVQLYFNRIKDPNTRLHQSALLCFNEDNPDVIKSILEETDKSMESIVTSLDQMVMSYKNSFRIKCVVVSDGVTQNWFIG